MTKTRTPGEIASDLAEIRDMIPLLERGYFEANDFSYSAGGVPSRGFSLAPPEIEPPTDHTQLTSLGAPPNDPTGSVVASNVKQHAIRQLRHAARELDIAVNALRSMQSALENVWPRDGDHYQQVIRPEPSFLTMAELEESVSHCSCEGRGYFQIGAERRDCPFCRSARAELARIGRMGRVGR